MFKKVVSIFAVLAFVAYSNQTLATTLFVGNTSNQEIITWANRQGITKYSEEKLFRPNDKITREQAAKMIYSFILSHPELTSSLPMGICAKFKDDANIDADIKESVYNACGLGLIKGFKGKVMPHGYISSTDARTFLMRVAALVPQIKDYIDSVVMSNTYYLTRIDMVRGLHILEQGIVGQTFAKEQTKLDAAKNLRTKSGLSNYTLQQTISCFCAPDSTRPMKYQVVAGYVNTGSVVYSDLSGGLVKVEEYMKLPTIDEVFARIQEAINDRVDSIVVEYDATYGYPKSLYIDRSKMIADEEMGYSYEVTTK